LAERNLISCINVGMLQDFHVNAVVGVVARQNGYSGLVPHQMKTQALHSSPFKVTLEIDGGLDTARKP